MFVGLFLCVCSFGFRPTRKSFTFMQTPPLPVKGLRILTYALHSWPLSIEGFFSMPHLHLYETSVYRGHLRGPVSLAPVAELLAVELSLTDLTSAKAGIRTPNIPHVCLSIYMYTHIVYSTKRTSVILKVHFSMQS